jgi:hypothetical protein
MANVTSSHHSRPIGVTVLAVLAGILAFFAAIHTLQALAILPYFVGPFSIRSFSLLYAVMWGLLVWVYIWLIQMLWNVQPAAWMFLVIITIFNLTFDFVVMLGDATWSDVSISFILNALILAYCMLPGVRDAFGTN